MAKKIYRGSFVTFAATSGHRASRIRKCPKCGRSYKFAVDIFSDIQPGEELDPLVAYRKLGIRPMREVERRLKKFI